MKSMLPMEKYFGKLELVYVFYGAMPTGVSVRQRDGSSVSSRFK